MLDFPQIGVALFCTKVTSKASSNATKEGASSEAMKAGDGNVGSASGNLATKRVRPWENCDNVQDLKRMLAEKDSEVEDLQIRLRYAEKEQLALSSAEDANPITSTNSKALQAQAAKLRRSIQSQVMSQMKYDHDAKHGTGKLNPFEVLDVTEPILELIVGEKHFKQAPHGSKQQVKLVLLNEDLEAIFNKKFSKKLRFGATLQLSYGLTFVFSKSKGSLTVSGAYKMVK